MKPAGRSTRPRPGHCHYRRSETVVLSWKNGKPVGHDFALGVKQELTPARAAALAILTDWSTVDDLSPLLPSISRRRLLRDLEQLRQWGLIQAAGDRPNRRRIAMEQWRAWSPEAAFFHFSVKNRPTGTLAEAERSRDLRQLFSPAPEPLKKPRAASPRLRLARPDRDCALSHVLLARRSWRRFGAAGITHAQLSTLVGMTWGVQRWIHVNGGARALKTSPSGGACHSLEAYVLAQRVTGVPRGIYHYHPERHDLEVVRRGLAQDAVAKFLRQPWFQGCAAAIVMTAMWERVQWKYSSSRSYRSVLIEIGHFAQTFALLATSLGLAPFCTGAFGDAELESALRIDGIRESAIFVVGVGSRPAGTEWAPWPDPAETPPTTVPVHLKKELQRKQRAERT